MNQAANTSDATGPAKDPFAFLKRLSWRKITIWGLFIAVGYLLRYFFFVMFVTFIVAYSMRSLVVRVERLISPNKSRLWLQRVLAVISFVILILSLYGAAQFFIPQLVDQGKGLADKVATIQKDPQKVIDDVLTDSVGYILLHNEYGGPSDPRYREAFELHKQKGLRDIAFDRFIDQDRELQVQFESDLGEKLLPSVRNQLAKKGPEEKKLRMYAWILKNQAPFEYELSPEIYNDKFEQWFEEVRADKGWGPLVQEERKPGFDRKDHILRYMTQEVIYNNPNLRAQAESKWEQSLAQEAVQNLKRSEPPNYRQRFEAFYKEQKKQEPKRYQYSAASFWKLHQVLQDQSGERAPIELFSQVYNTLPEDERQTKADHNDFELHERKTLIDNWKKTQFAKTLETLVEDEATKGLAVVGTHLGAFVTSTVNRAIHFVLALMLAFFITFDAPRIKRGVDRLAESRVKNLYEEIAPGLINFGRLIGRAFIAQGLIAICNTLLTFAALYVLGIERQIFLSAIVFICSFIPVLGVILSTVPIAITAVVQPDGGFILALLAVAAVLMIHFIEASIFNPKIVGEIMHLHPVLVLAILVAGEHFFGVWGLLLGVPVTVYIIRFLILDEGIPGIIEPVRAHHTEELQTEAQAGSEMPAQESQEASEPDKTDGPQIEEMPESKGLEGPEPDLGAT